jgi:hypothetical protein
MIDPKEVRERGEYKQPGDMWFEPEALPDPDEGGNEVDWYYPDQPNAYLTTKYRDQHKANRLPLTVMLPDGGVWCVDARASTPGAGGWDVTGTPPNITVRPSILTDRYHGWLTDGVLSDDLDGRQYEMTEGGWDIKRR